MTYKTINCYNCGEPHSVDSSAFFQCRKCGAPNLVRDWYSRKTDEEYRAEEIAMKEEKRSSVISVFRTKYDELKIACPEVGSFDESCIYQNPDGGWQMTFIGQGAITLSNQYFSQNIFVPYFTCGAIFRRWIAEGGAWDENHVKGRFGYPTEDAETCLNTEDGVDALQRFESGHIRSFRSGETEICTLSETPPLSSPMGKVLKWTLLLPITLLMLPLEILIKAEEPWRGPMLYPQGWQERKKV